MDLVADKLIDIFEGIIKWLFESLIEPFTGLGSLKDLVFGKVSEGELVWGTFRATDLTDGLNPLFYTMAALSGFVIVSFIVLYGMRIAGGPINPQRRIETIELLKDLLIVGIVLVNLPTLYDLLFSINQGITKMFGGAYESNLDSLKEDHSEEVSGVIGYMFVQLILLGLAIWANFYYLMRKVTLIILMGMGPLMLAFWLHPRFKPITSSWLKELIGSIFVQSIHAFVFWTVATISATSSGFIETVIVYLIFIPISESIRRLLLMGGDMQGGLSKAGAMLGMGALAGMYGSVKGALGDNSVMGAIRGGINGLRNGKGKGDATEGSAFDETKGTLGANPGSDNGTTPQAEKMLKSGDIMSRAGKAVFGMAGAIAGSPMGPMSSILGATGGSAIGGVIGGVTGRVGTSAIQGIAARHKLGTNAFKEGGIGKNSDVFDENYVNEIADRETANWADENEDAEMSRLRELHPDATNTELESKFDKIQADKRAGFYSDAKEKFAAAHSANGTMASGDQLVATSSQAMADQWGNDNQKSFFADYEKANPRQEGESEEQFANRRMNAFQDKKDQMRNTFAEKGNQIVSSMGIDGNEPIDKTEFNQKLSDAVVGITGVSSAHSLTNAGKQAVSNMQNKTATGKELVDSSSQAMANQWENDNQSAFFTDYDKVNPRQDGETDQAYTNRRMNAFQDKKNQMKDSFAEKGNQIVSQMGGNDHSPIDKQMFSDKLASSVQDTFGIANTESIARAGTQAVSNVKSNIATGDQLVSASSQAMADQWGNDNQSAFIADYEKNNPRQEGESKHTYMTRGMNAFQGRKNQIKNAFVEKGQQVISSLGVSGSDPVNVTTFNDQLSSAVGSMSGITSVGAVQRLSEAAYQAVQHVQGGNVIQSNGTPNTLLIASRMAQAKTEQMKGPYIVKQQANGASFDEATQSWNEAMPSIRQENLNMYTQSAQAAEGKTFSNGFAGIAQHMGDVGSRAGSYLSASSGISGFVQGTKMLNHAVRTGLTEAGASLSVSTEYGMAGIASYVKGVKHSTTDGIRGAMTSIAEQNGGVIETQNNLQNSVGYVAGMVLGPQGYQIGKSTMTRLSPFKQQVQEEIKAPSEVIQMAQTTNDGFGNETLARGAIRQVTTPTESYIEVRTKSGETQVVSRKGSGHSGLRNGDVIYQDLDIQGDSLVVSSPKGGKSSTYRIDSGGGRVPSSIAIESNPNELLGSPRISTNHRPSQRTQLPSYSQSVDSGQFYIEDLQSQGMENIQVIVEKDRQFVTAQKEGVTYRVSPMYAGDTKLQGSESIKIPVTVRTNQLKPTNPISGSTVSVNSEMTTVEDGRYSTYPNDPKMPYYSSKTVNTLIPSKSAIRAQRGLDKRKQLDEVRRKQGLLG